MPKFFIVLQRATGVLSTVLPQSSQAVQHVIQREMVKTMCRLLKVVTVNTNLLLKCHHSYLLLLVERCHCITHIHFIVAHVTTWPEYVAYLWAWLFVLCIHVLYHVSSKQHKMQQSQRPKFSLYMHICRNSTKRQFFFLFHVTSDCHHKFNVYPHSFCWF